MTKSEKAKALAATRELEEEGITAGMIETYIPTVRIHRYYASVFRHGNRGRLRVLVDHVRKNKAEHKRPNQRHKPTAPRPVRRARNGQGSQMFMVFSGHLARCVQAARA
ncbi:MAG: hypothetical protein HY462_01320 [Parcubacteria group bacterium]|nr:hypothetical protein [Parcubacteria group bacterium]